MHSVRRFASHAQHKVLPPKNAGVVFDSRATPIRYALPFKPWIFLCMVGFSGAMCGNYFFTNFVLRRNPPNNPQRAIHILRMSKRLQLLVLAVLLVPVESFRYFQKQYSAFLPVKQDIIYASQHRGREVAYNVPKDYVKRDGSGGYDNEFFACNGSLHALNGEQTEDGIYGNQLSEGCMGINAGNGTNVLENSSTCPPDSVESSQDQDAQHADAERPIEPDKPDSATDMGDSFKRMMIPYTINYPVNMEDLNDLDMNTRHEKAKERMDQLGFFKPLDHDADIANTKTYVEPQPTDSYSLTMSALDSDEKVWECMKTSSMPQQMVTKQATRESVSFQCPSRMDYESIRNQWIIGRARIHWFPRYFGKSLGELSEHIKMCDVILDVRDARLPYVADSDFLLNVYNNLFTHKPKVLVFTHADLASIRGMEDWGTYYRIKNFWEAQEFNKNIPEPNRRPVTPIIFVDAKNGISCIIRLKKLIYKLCARVNQRRLRRGLAPRPLRAIALGMPNVGKSALINRLLGRHKSRSFNAAGVTRDIRLVRLHPDEYREAAHKIIDVIDTPGVLPANLYNMAFNAVKGKSNKKRNRLLGNMYFNLPKTPIPGGHSKAGIDAQYMRVERNVWLIAAANQIVEGAYDNDQAAENLLEQMLEVYRRTRSYLELPRVLKRIGLPYSQNMLDMDPSEFSHICLQTASHKHHGGDVNSAASRILADFRRGYYGRITLQMPPQEVPNRYCVPLHAARETEKEQGEPQPRIEYSQGIYEGW
ncbi:hypothetical protein X943_003263 [Babesia divergens]|uniref:G domain-containing protein n=1 Tax=Babesia divergens TaxID=32595 RepID=A0AAD9GHU5_BABDI|nr:hypothetical protein X943_003263 [Babesia divergens]